ncbi:zinc finger CCCH-type with G patch domain-containing protein-like [Ptychodera flava]|uniref:zinc finger CCCH-type with G patch domain-containing protein-like n=1 Tax=Ptychodera flava TaxID=63121 RepID=UPI00396A762C
MLKSRSLDVCAELREKKKLGILKTMKKKRKNVKRLQDKNIERRVHDVFDFLNRKLGGSNAERDTSVPINKEPSAQRNRNENSSGKREKEHSSRNLNIQLMKTHEDMKDLEKELTRLKEARKRNAGKFLKHTKGVGNGIIIP